MNENLLDMLIQQPFIVGLAVFFIFILIAIALWLSIKQGREVSFWPPRIGQKITTIKESNTESANKIDKSGQYLDKIDKVDTNQVRSDIFSIRPPAPIIALLIELVGPEAGKIYFITTGIRSVTIGRNENCEVSIKASSVSRVHCRIIIIPREGERYAQRDFQFMLIDSGSDNGTFINGRLIQKHELLSGDVIEMGGAKISFVKGDPFRTESHSGEN